MDGLGSGLKGLNGMAPGNNEKNSLLKRVSTWCEIMILEKLVVIPWKV